MTGHIVAFTIAAAWALLLTATCAGGVVWLVRAAAKARKTGRRVT